MCLNTAYTYVPSLRIPAMRQAGQHLNDLGCQVGGTGRDAALPIRRRHDFRVGPNPTWRPLNPSVNRKTNQCQGLDKPVKYGTLLCMKNTERTGGGPGKSFRNGLSLMDLFKMSRTMPWLRSGSRISADRTAIPSASPAPIMTCKSVRRMRTSRTAAAIGTAASASR